MTEQAALKSKSFQLVKFLCFLILMDNKMVESYNSFRDMRKMTEHRRHGIKKTKNCQPLNIKEGGKKDILFCITLFIMYWKNLFAQVTYIKYFLSIFNNP